jgi:hypothetical protein
MISALKRRLRVRSRIETALSTFSEEYHRGIRIGDKLGCIELANAPIYLRWGRRLCP